MSVIQAGNTTTTSLIYTGDTTGNLVFTTGGANTVALTLANTQAATFSGPVSLSNTLAVTGNASFSGQITGNTTFSGYLTTSAQPAFFGYRSAGNVTSPNTILHNTIITNRGSCYNSSTGIFTVPVAGLYEVIAGGHAENSQPVSIVINQNGSIVVEEYTNGSAYGSATVVIIMSCAVNDQISSSVATGTMWGGNRSGLRMSVKYLG